MGERQGRKGGWREVGRERGREGGGWRQGGRERERQGGREGRRNGWESG